MSEPIFMFDGEDPAMKLAYEDAQRSFKYFWRELSWERRRIVPGLDLSIVKLPFSDGLRTDGRPQYEHMWIGEVDFDGETLTGKLLNSPNWLTSVRGGDTVRVPFSHLTDWMMTSDGRAYGGFTVNSMRARMSNQERKQHDNAWGLDFGDPTEVKVEIERDKKPKGPLLPSLFGKWAKNSNPAHNFRDHPMCLNMLEKIEDQLKADPSLAQASDDGWTLLHREALAGNLGIVKLLIAYGAKPGEKNPHERSASELARSIGWHEIAQYLDEQPTA